jgi:DNA polymerase-3 subunit delta
MKKAAPELVRHRAVLVAGPEHVLRRRTVASALAALGLTTADFDVEQFNADSRPVAEWLASAGTAPFLGERRVSIVRHVYRVSKPGEALTKAAIDALPATALMLMVGDDENAATLDAQRRLETNARAWAALAANKTLHRVECKVPPAQVQALLREEAASLGKPLTPGAAAKLAELGGYSYSLASDELQKVALYVGDGTGIQEADVLAAATPSPEWNVWRMIDAMLAGQIGRALQDARALIGRSKRPEEQIHAEIIPQLLRTLRLAWQAKAQAERVPPAQYELVRPALSQAPEPGQRAAAALARRLTYGQLRGCLEEVARLDASTKGLLPCATALDALEIMVLRLAEVVRREAG